MGTTSSRSQVTPVVVASWSEEQLSEAIKELGPAYEEYGQACVANGITGEVLLKTDEAVLPDVLQDLGVKTMHQTRLTLEVKKLKEGSDAMETEQSSERTTNATSKRFAAFLSHFKHECGTEARLVQQNLKQIIVKGPIKGGGHDIFLDSDDLSDLRNLLQHVKDTQVLVLLQSKGVLTRPWVIMELHTAITSGVPIVALNVQKGSCPYDYPAASEFLLHFDKDIDIANPGAAQLLIDWGIDPVDVAWRLSDCLPNIISTTLNPNGSERQIQASLEDLADSMRKAVPIAPSMSKEEWLAMREMQKPREAAPKKEHGSSGVQRVTAVDAQAVSVKSLADVPAAVPELPNAYLVRDEDLSQLKAALLAHDGASGTSLTSKKQQNKVGAHGMGGVGKTTIAAAMAYDEGIRTSFDKIAWVSVGQEPDIRELQDSIHHQLTKQHLQDTAKTEADIVTALRDAAKGTKVLLILDDVWNPKHEKPLNCIDCDLPSRLLVTTRVRGLLKNASEVDVGVLSQPEALKLLLASAEVHEEDVEDGSEDHGVATKVVELCGRLPLTLAVVGGMVADNGQGFTEDILEALEEKQELEDEEGMTVETRVISSSVKMMIKGAGKHQDLVEKVFHFFAIFPEDVPVPAPFFNKMAPMLSDDKNEKKARLAVGSSLGTLLKYNLIKGSLAAGSGVFMHDIVRDYVIAQHSPDELRVLQRSVVDAVLAARPEPDGFPIIEFAAVGSFETYAVRQLYWHFRCALRTGEEPPDAWWVHSDNSIRANVAMAVGLEALDALSGAREVAGELVNAAQASWTASMMRGIHLPTFVDLLYRTAGLLERRVKSSADDKKAAEFEDTVLALIWNRDMFSGSERYQLAMDRALKLGTEMEATYESKLREFMALCAAAFTKMGILGGEPDFDASLDAWQRCVRAAVEGGNLSDVRTYTTFFCKLNPLACMSCSIVLSSFEAWHPDNFGRVSEAEVVKALDEYEYQVDGEAFKNGQQGVDWFRAGVYIPVVALWYGNMEAVDIWRQKTIAVCGEYKEFPKDYKSELQEIHSPREGGIPILNLLGLFSKSFSLLNAFGFSWDEEGLDRIDTFAQLRPGDNVASITAHLRMEAYLSSPKGAIDENVVGAWIPSASELAKMEKDDPFMRTMIIMDLTSSGARAFLKLGRDDDAYELSRIAVSPEQGTYKQTTLMPCYSILGQVAAKRGDLDEASGHFANAVEAAKVSRLPIMELIAARDWKRYLLEPNGRDCSAAETIIDGACLKMKKSPEQLASVLASEYF